MASLENHYLVLNYTKTISLLDEVTRILANENDIKYDNVYK